MAALATSPPPDLRSSFRPTYNLAVNLVRRYRVDQAHYILDRSFAQFLDRGHHHALSRRLDRALALLERFGLRGHDGMDLTARGRSLAGIYHESDLLVAEALAEGLFDGLDPAELAARRVRRARSRRARVAPRSLSHPPESVRPRLARAARHRRAGAGRGARRAPAPDARPR